MNCFRCLSFWAGVKATLDDFKVDTFAVRASRLRKKW